MVKFDHLISVVHIVFIRNVVRHAVVTGWDETAAFNHKRYYVFEVLIDRLFTLSKNTLVDAAYHDHIGELLCKFNNIIAWSDLEGTHDIHSYTFFVKSDRFGDKAVGVYLDEEFLILLTASDVWVEPLDNVMPLIIVKISPKLSESNVDKTSTEEEKSITPILEKLKINKVE